MGPIKYATETLSSNIYSSLKINPGEVKIILAAIIERIDGSAEFGESDRSVFGLLLANPPMKNHNQYHYFFPNSIVVFKPQEGLFDDTPPK